MLDEVNFELCGGKVPGDLRVRTSQQNKYLRMSSDREEGVKLAAGLRVQVVAVGKVIHKEGGVVFLAADVCIIRGWVRAVRRIRHFDISSAR
jgi:hypothetical protein